MKKRATVDRVLADFGRLTTDEQIAVAKFIAHQGGLKLFTEAEVKQMFAEAGKPKAEPVINGVVRLK